MGITSIDGVVTGPDETSETLRFLVAAAVANRWLRGLYHEMVAIAA